MGDRSRNVERYRYHGRGSFAFPGRSLRRLAEQLRQRGDVGRDPPRLGLREQLCGRSPVIVNAKRKKAAVMW
jgi:hypothetical protein